MTYSLAKTLALGAAQKNPSLLIQLSWWQCFLPFPRHVGLAGLARSVWLAPAAARQQDPAQWRRQAHPCRHGWRRQGSGATAHVRNAVRHAQRWHLVAMCHRAGQLPASSSGPASGSSIWCPPAQLYTVGRCLWLNSSLKSHLPLE